MTKLENGIITVRAEHPAYKCKICNIIENSVVKIEEHFRKEHCEMITVKLPDRYFKMNESGFSIEVDEEGKEIK